MGIAVVTGTSSGIGLHTALTLAARGHRVYAGIRNLARAQTLQEQARQRALQVHLLELDVSNDDSVTLAFEEVLSDGPVDVLVNNAGVGAASPLELTPLDEHQSIFNTNYFGAIRCIQAVLPGMRERGAGAIINVSSVEGLVAFPNQVAYSASKWALECASEALAHEVYRFGIRVCAIEPGVVETQIFDNAAPFTRYDKRSPYQPIMRRNGKFFSAGRRAGTSAQRVADTIVEALEAPEYRLRWLVGEDAQSLAAGRRRINDEAWIEMGGDLADEEYQARFKRYFGISL